MNKLPKYFVVQDIRPLEEIIDRYVQWVFDHSGQDKELTASRLKITARTLYNRIDENRLTCELKKKKKIEEQVSNNIPIELPTNIVAD